MPIDLITADPPAENADPWFGPRAAFDAQVKATANAAAAKADLLEEEPAPTWDGLGGKPASIAAGATAAQARSAIGLGTAATQSAGAFASSVQGEKADSAVQPDALENKANLAGGKVPLAELPAATTDAAGIAERATNAEAAAGADTTRYVTPAQLKTAVAEAAAAFAVIVTYGANPATPRPDVPNTVVWVGADDVVPTEMLESDLRLKYEGGSSFVGPFDMLTTPHRALSLRRLLASYTGPAIRVRRSSDDAEMNIGLDSDGGLDTSALLAFAGAGSAYVTTWYDQSGNVRNMTQATAAAQPRIVDSGVLDTVNSRPAVVFDGTDDFLTSTITGLYAAGATTVASVARVGGSASAVILGELADNSTATGNQGSYRIMRRVTTSGQWNWQLNAGNSQVYGLNATGDTSWNDAQHQLFGIDTGSAISSWRDGVAAHASATATRGAVPTLQRTSLGASGGITPGGFAIAAFQELVLWGSDESTDRAAISAAQKAFWGTP